MRKNLDRVVASLKNKNEKNQGDPTGMLDHLHNFVARRDPSPK
jgi:hypothetical protein